MKSVAISILLGFLSFCAFASEVRWNCFALHDLGEANSIGCYYYDTGYSSPEIGLRYVYDKSGSVHLDGKGAANIGWNVAIWVDAVAGDILNRSYFSRAHTVLKDSYNSSVPYPITLNSTGDAMDVQRNEHFYIALIGNYYNDDNEPCDYYGWVEFLNTGSELAIQSSAFSYDSIAVGIGTTPEPSTACLLLISLSTLAIRRKIRVGSDNQS